MRLSPEHTTLALNEGHVSNMLEAVAAVRSSLKAMESLVQQASRLSLWTPQTSPVVGVRAKRSGARTSDAESQFGIVSGNASDTSGAIKSEDDFASIGYVYEHSDLESHPFTPSPNGPPGCSRIDATSAGGQCQVERPGTQTLAGLNAEAVAEKTKANSRRKQRKKPTTSNGGSRHRVPRACKMMKEAYFKGME